MVEKNEVLRIHPLRVSKSDPMAAANLVRYGQNDFDFFLPAVNISPELAGHFVVQNCPR